MDFSIKVLEKLKEIPKGKLTTYKLLARSVGRSRSIRPIANILAKNFWPERFPCYKVIKSDGKIGGYKLGVQKKKALLNKEGIRIKNNKVINFRKYLYPF